MTSTKPSDHLTAPATRRERIDLLLDEALEESFPASDSSAISSSTTAIRNERRDRAEGPEAVD
jgi:hypothetical protein